MKPKKMSSPPECRSYNPMIIQRIDEGHKYFNTLFEHIKEGVTNMSLHSASLQRETGDIKKDFSKLSESNYLNLETIDELREELEKMQRQNEKLIYQRLADLDMIAERRDKVVEIKEENVKYEKSINKANKKKNYWRKRHYGNHHATD